MKIISSYKTRASVEARSTVLQKNTKALLVEKSKFIWLNFRFNTTKQRKLLKILDGSNETSRLVQNNRFGGGATVLAENSNALQSKVFDLFLT